jgi:hypothetical protein
MSAHEQDDRVTRGGQPLIPSWKQQLRCELGALRGGRSAWTYRRNLAASVEPTVLACLGLLASGDGETSTSDLATSHEAALWLVAIQRSDGSLPVSEGRSRPGWATPYAIMLWSALPGYEEPARRASAWLLGSEGATLSIAENADNIIGHDPSLVGWPWVSGTHSWLEPTALAILALCRLGLADHPRVHEGRRLMLDRTLASGGWNYGNRSVFGTELRAQPGPTGLALLALAAVGAQRAAVARASAYLRQSMSDLRAPVSLGWALIGLRAVGPLPEEYETCIEEAHARCAGKPDAAMGLALLLLASGEQALCLLGIPVAGESSPGKPS